MTKYLTPEQLGIKQEEFDGLVKLREFFSKESRPTVIDDDLQNVEEFLDDEVVRTIMGFSMGYGAAVVGDESADAYSCGCAACIGGHLSLVMQGADVSASCFTKDGLIEANNYVVSQEGHPTLDNLFYPREIYTDDWNRITPKLAADAIDNYLTHASPLWKSIAIREGLRLKPSHRG
jgi:hypothetical protein